MAGNAAKQKRALEFYELNGKNAAKTAKHVKVSRQTIMRWKAAGHPIAITKGKSWDDYLEEKTDRELLDLRKDDAAEHMDFLDESRKTLSIVLREMKIKFLSSEFEARPADLKTIIEMYAKLETRDLDMKNWMNGVMVQMLERLASVVSTEQYTLIVTLFSEVNRAATEKLDLVVDPGLPQLPSHEEAKERDTNRLDIVEIPYADVDYEVT